MLDASRIPPGLLEGRLALVSGVGRPHGLEIALGLARAGASIIAIDSSLADVTAAASAIRAAHGRAWNFALDATSAEACGELARRLTREIGPIDILVNHAGFGVRERSAPERTEREWRRALDASVVRTLNLAHAWMPALSLTRGCVIIVAPGALPVMRLAHAGTGGTPQSKGAVQTTTLSLAREMAPHGVRVNAVAPGLITLIAERAPAGAGATVADGAPAGDLLPHGIDRRSPSANGPRPSPRPASIDMLHDGARTLGAVASERAALLEQRVPMGRAGEPSELVAPTVFLASGMSSYVTGVVLPVDGGLFTAA